jgi:nitroreductase
MNLHQLIIDRRTIHDYREAPLPVGAVDRAIEAAIAAPNHRMTEPWHFVQAGPDTRARLLDIAVAIKSAEGTLPLGEAVLEKLTAKLLRPSVLLGICQCQQPDPGIAREDYAAVACAVQNAMLSLWSEGIGSKWSTGAVTTDPRTYEALKVNASQHQIVGFLWIGHSARQEAPKARRRRSATDVLTRLP